MRKFTAIYWIMCGLFIFLMDQYSILTSTQLLFIAILLTSIQLSFIVWGEEDIK
jgi:hypothetical protein